MTSVVEVRCPNGDTPGRLFTKLRLGEETARMIQPQNLIEFTCSDCAGLESKRLGRAVRVFHRFNFIGEHIATLMADRA